MDEWDEPDATEAGRLFVAKLLDEIDCLRRELYDMQYTIRIEQTVKDLNLTGFRPVTVQL